jgi:hypothetical protein
MALVKGTNSYVTVAEAEIYFSDRVDVKAWTNADETVKSQALTTATTILDNLDWAGVVLDSSQTLAFPRSGEYFDTRLGMLVYSTTTVPDRIIKATFEQALHLLNNEGLLDSTGTIANLSISGISLSTIRNPPKVPMTVKRLIDVLLSRSSLSKSWWRAN